MRGDELSEEILRKKDPSNLQLSATETNYVEDIFCPATPPGKSAAVRSKNEFLKVPLILYVNFRSCD